jgi:hypothetical protein
MSVKEILILCAEILDDANLKNYFLNAEIADEQTASEDAELLLKCYNLVADEISREYFLLTYEETFTPENGEISYLKFTKNPVLIKSVNYLNGVEANCSINPVSIYVNKPVKVTYAYACDEKTLNDISDFTATKISKRVLAYGVVVEYSLIKGMYEQAVTWRDKYRESLQSCLGVKKSRKIKARKWF